MKQTIISYVALALLIAGVCLAHDSDVHSKFQDLMYIGDGADVDGEFSLDAQVVDDNSISLDFRVYVDCVEAHELGAVAILALDDPDDIESGEMLLELVARGDWEQEGGDPQQPPPDVDAPNGTDPHQNGTWSNNGTNPHQNGTWSNNGTNPHGNGTWSNNGTNPHGNDTEHHPPRECDDIFSTASNDLVVPTALFLEWIKEKNVVVVVYDVNSEPLLYGSLTWPCLTELGMDCDDGPIGDCIIIDNGVSDPIVEKFTGYDGPCYSNLNRFTSYHNEIVIAHLYGDKYVATRTIVHHSRLYCDEPAYEVRTKYAANISYLEPLVENWGSIQVGGALLTLDSVQIRILRQDYYLGTLYRCPEFSQKPYNISEEFVDLREFNCPWAYENLDIEEPEFECEFESAIIEICVDEDSLPEGLSVNGTSVAYITEPQCISNGRQYVDGIDFVNVLEDAYHEIGYWNNQSTAVDLFVPEYLLEPYVCKNPYYTPNPHGGFLGLLNPSTAGECMFVDGFLFDEYNDIPFDPHCPTNADYHMCTNNGSCWCIYESHEPPYCTSDPDQCHDNGGYCDSKEECRGVSYDPTYTGDYTIHGLFSSVCVSNSRLNNSEGIDFGIHRTPYYGEDFRALHSRYLFGEMECSEILIGIHTHLSMNYTGYEEWWFSDFTTDIGIVKLWPVFTTLEVMHPFVAEEIILNCPTMSNVTNGSIIYLHEADCEWLENKVGDYLLPNCLLTGTLIAHCANDSMNATSSIYMTDLTCASDIHCEQHPFGQHIDDAVQTFNYVSAMSGEDFNVTTNVLDAYACPRPHNYEPFEFEIEHLYFLHTSTRYCAATHHAHDIHVTTDDCGCLGDIDREECLAEHTCWCTNMYDSEAGFCTDSVKDCTRHGGFCEGGENCISCKDLEECVADSYCYCHVDTEGEGSSSFCTDDFAACGDAGGSCEPLDCSESACECSGPHCKLGGLECASAGACWCSKSEGTFCTTEEQCDAIGGECDSFEVCLDNGGCWCEASDEALCVADEMACDNRGGSAVCPIDTCEIEKNTEIPPEMALFLNGTMRTSCLQTGGSSRMSGVVLDAIDEHTMYLNLQYMHAFFSDPECENIAALVTDSGIIHMDIMDFHFGTDYLESEILDFVLVPVGVFEMDLASRNLIVYGEGYYGELLEHCEELSSLSLGVDTDVSQLTCDHFEEVFGVPLLQDCSSIRGVSTAACSPIVFSERESFVVLNSMECVVYNDTAGNDTMSEGEASDDDFIGVNLVRTLGYSAQSLDGLRFLGGPESASIAAESIRRSVGALTRPVCMNNQTGMPEDYIRTALTTFYVTDHAFCYSEEPGHVDATAYCDSFACREEPVECRVGGECWCVYGDDASICTDFETCFDIGGRCQLGDEKVEPLPEDLEECQSEGFCWCETSFFGVPSRCVEADDDCYKVGGFCEEIRADCPYNDTGIAEDQSPLEKLRGVWSTPCLRPQYDSTTHRVVHHISGGLNGEPLRFVRSTHHYNSKNCSEGALSATFVLNGTIDASVSNLSVAAVLETTDFHSIMANVSLESHSLTVYTDDVLQYFMNSCGALLSNLTLNAAYDVSDIGHDECGVLSEPSLSSCSERVGWAFLGCSPVSAEAPTFLALSEFPCTSEGYVPDLYEFAFSLRVFGDSMQILELDGGELMEAAATGFENSLCGFDNEPDLDSTAPFANPLFYDRIESVFVKTDGNNGCSLSDNAHVVQIPVDQGGFGSACRVLPDNSLLDYSDIQFHTYYAEDGLWDFAGFLYNFKRDVFVRDSEGHVKAITDIPIRPSESDGDSFYELLDGAVSVNCGTGDERIEMTYAYTKPEIVNRKTTLQHGVYVVAPAGDFYNEFIRSRISPEVRRVSEMEEDKVWIVVVYRRGVECDDFTGCASYEYADELLEQYFNSHWEGDFWDCCHIDFEDRTDASTLLVGSKNTTAKEIGSARVWNWLDGDERHRESECTADNVQSLLTRFQNSLDALRTTRDIDELYLMIEDLEHTISNDAWATCESPLFDHVEYNTRQTQRFTDECKEDYFSPSWFEDPCCNWALGYEECCVERLVVETDEVPYIGETSFEEMCPRVHPSRRASLLGQVNDYIQSRFYVRKDSCSPENAFKKYEQAWEKLDDFVQECQREIFGDDYRGKKCDRDDQCFSGECISNTGRCVVNWEKTDNLLAECYADRMDPILERYLRLQWGLTGRSSRGDFNEQFHERTSAYSCHGPTGWDKTTSEECLETRGCNWRPCQWLDGVCEPDAERTAALEDGEWHPDMCDESQHGAGMWVNQTKCEQKCMDDSLPSHMCGSCWGVECWDWMELATCSYSRVLSPEHCTELDGYWQTWNDQGDGSCVMNVKNPSYDSCMVESGGKFCLTEESHPGETYCDDFCYVSTTAIDNADDCGAFADEHSAWDFWYDAHREVCRTWMVERCMNDTEFGGQPLEFFPGRSYYAGRFNSEEKCTGQCSPFWELQTQSECESTETCSVHDTCEGCRKHWNFWYDAPLCYSVDVNETECNGLWEKGSHWDSELSVCTFEYLNWNETQCEQHGYHHFYPSCQNVFAGDDELETCGTCADDDAECRLTMKHLNCTRQAVTCDNEADCSQYGRCSDVDFMSFPTCIVPFEEQEGWIYCEQGWEARIGCSVQHYDEATCESAGGTYYRKPATTEKACSAYGKVCSGERWPGDITDKGKVKCQECGGSYEDAFDFVQGTMTPGYWEEAEWRERQYISLNSWEERFNSEIFFGLLESAALDQYSISMQSESLCKFGCLQSQFVDFLCECTDIDVNSTLCEDYRFSSCKVGLGKLFSNIRNVLRGGKRYRLEFNADSINPNFDSIDFEAKSRRIDFEGWSTQSGASFSSLAEGTDEQPCDEYSIVKYNGRVVGQVMNKRTVTFTFDGGEPLASGKTVTVCVQKDSSITPLNRFSVPDIGKSDLSDRSVVIPLGANITRNSDDELCGTITAVNGIELIAVRRVPNFVLHQRDECTFAGQSVVVKGATFSASLQEILVTFQGSAGTNQGGNSSTCSALSPTTVALLGTGATCQWRGPFVLAVRLGTSGVGISAGSRVIVNGEVVRERLNANQGVFGNATVGVPSNAVTPVARVVSATKIGGCFPLRIDGKSSSGARLTYTWSLQSGTDDSDAIATILANANDQGRKDLSLAADLFQPGSYVFSLRVADFLERSSTTTQTVVKVAGSLPVARINRDPQFTWPGSRRLSINVEVIPGSACDGARSFKDISYNWIVENQDDDTWTLPANTKRNRQSLDLAANVLRAGDVFTVICEVCELSACVNSSVQVTSEPEALRAVFRAKQITITTANHLRLDGSLSSDPSATSETAVFSWSACKINRFLSSTDPAFCNADLIPDEWALGNATGKILELANSTLIEGDFRFTLTYTKGARTASADVLVTILSSSQKIPLFGIVREAPPINVERVDPSKPVKLSARFIGQRPVERVLWTWSVSDEDTSGFELVVGSTVSSASLNLPVLAIASSALPEGQDVILTLSGRFDQNDSVTVSSDITITVNDLPSGGSMVVTTLQSGDTDETSSTVGTFLETTFYFECSGWSDNDGVEFLEYRFGRILNGVPTPSSGWATASRLSRDALPVGNYSVYCEVRDAQKALARSNFVDIQVNPYVPDENADLSNVTSEFLASLNTETMDLSAVADAVSGLTDLVFSAGDGDALSEAELEQQAAAVGQLMGTMFSSAFGSTDGDTNTSLSDSLDVGEEGTDVVGQYAGSVGAMLQNSALINSQPGARQQAAKFLSELAGSLEDASEVVGESTVATLLSSMANMMNSLSEALEDGDANAQALGDDGFRFLAGESAAKQQLESMRTSYISIYKNIEANQLVGEAATFRPGDNSGEHSNSIGVIRSSLPSNTDTLRLSCDSNGTATMTVGDLGFSSNDVDSVSLQAICIGPVTTLYPSVVDTIADNFTMCSQLVQFEVYTRATADDSSGTLADVQNLTNPVTIQLTIVGDIPEGMQCVPRFVNGSSMLSDAGLTYTPAVNGTTLTFTSTHNSDFVAVLVDIGGGTGSMALPSMTLMLVTLFTVLLIIGNYFDQ